ncbi:hypothetical protein ACFFHF_17160 [Robertmurraya beringensis]|uniref:Uncharacterized protein n=1 Tax=Robertmurraya beringensis TaxID=641660 RepID=A0ABV6KVK6_9BACI
MKLVESNITVSLMHEGEWYFIEVHGFSNEITGIKIDAGKFYIQFIGGDFEEPQEFWIEYNQSAFNEMWQYEFRSDFSYSILPEELTLGMLNDLFMSAYSMVKDQSYTCKHMGESM